MKHLLGLLVALCVSTGCAKTLTDAERADGLAVSLHAIDPLAEPLPPRPPPENGVPAFNTEYWLGSEAEEKEQFADFSSQIQALQKAASDDRGQPIQRGFHAKSHACLNGTLQLDASRLQRTRFGVFSDEKVEHRVVVRFSNGVGWRQGDSELDARGMAVKVFDVPGAKYLPDEPTTQDFLMTNAPTPVGRDAVEFMQFAHANAKGRLAGLFFLVAHAGTAGPALTKTGAIDSMATAQYWSGGAFHLGAHQAIKFTAKPCDATLERHPNRDSPDYLAADLKDAATSGLCMALYVQFQTDPIKTPIENASVEWTEAISPLVRVGSIVMPGQEVWGTAECDQLTFSPWHSIAAHKPMGHINRARRFVYDASQKYRHGDAGVVP